MHVHKYALLFASVALVSVYGIPFNVTNAHRDDLKTDSNVKLLEAVDYEAPKGAFTEAPTKSSTAKTKRGEQQRTTTTKNDNSQTIPAKSPTNGTTPGEVTSAVGRQPSQAPYGVFIAIIILLVIVIYFYCICKHVNIYSRVMFSRHRKRKDRLARNI